MFWTFAFWMSALYLTNSGLGLVRALVDSRWYEDKAIRFGVEPDRKRLVMTKMITLTCGAMLALWLGSKAGYI